MKTSISKAALSSGLLVYLIILAFLFSHAGSFILLAIYIVPGLLYGLALTASAPNTASAVGSVLFVILSVVINIACVYYVCQDFVDQGRFAGLKLVVASSVGAVSLTSCYDFLLLRRFSVFRTIAMPSILGMAASLVSALCMYFLIPDKENGFVATILWVGMLAIFPLWQYLIGFNLAYHVRSNHPVELSEPGRK